MRHCFAVASRPSIEFIKAGVRRCTSARCGAGCLWMCVSECIVEDAREGSAERGNDWSFLPFTNCEGRETSPVQDIRHLIWFLDYIAVWTAAGRNILAPYEPFALFVFLLSDRVKITWHIHEGNDSPFQCKRSSGSFNFKIKTDRIIEDWIKINTQSP